MPKKKFENIPFHTVVRLDTNTPVSINQVKDILRNYPDGVSLCVRSAEGHPDRGGYFFHLLLTSNDLSQCELYNFEKTLVATLAVEQITLFINHCSGLDFNEWVLQFCQSVVNFRLDPAKSKTNGVDTIDADVTGIESLE